jgi:dCMP deaminase
MKPKFKRYFMGIAQLTSQLSHARRLRVGAVVVKDDRVISIGYNGMPAGWDNDCEYVEWMGVDAGGWLSPEEIKEGWPYIGYYKDKNGNTIEGRYRFKTKPEVLHAESNAIAKLARSHESGDGADLFVTHSPCIECAKLIYQSGIRRVYFGESYRDNSGVEFLRSSGVGVEQYNANQDND